MLSALVSSLPSSNRFRRQPWSTPHFELQRWISRSSARHHTSWVRTGFPSPVRLLLTVATLSSTSYAGSKELERICSTYKRLAMRFTGLKRQPRHGWWRWRGCTAPLDRDPAHSGRYRVVQLKQSRKARTAGPQGTAGLQVWGLKQKDSTGSLPQGRRSPICPTQREWVDQRSNCRRASLASCRNRHGRW